MLFVCEFFHLIVGLICVLVWFAVAVAIGVVLSVCVVEWVGDDELAGGFVMGKAVSE